MKKLILVIFCLLIFDVVRGQNISPDSLIKLVLSIKETATKRPENPDSILRKLFLIKSPAGRIRAVYDIILLENGEMKFNRALYYHRKILAEAKKHHDPIIESVITGELGFILASNGDYPEGYKTLLSALAIAEKTGNKQAIGTVYDNLGVSYQGNLNTSIAYYKKALQYSSAAGDYLFAGFELGNIGGTFLLLHQPDSARYYLIKGINLAVEKKVAIVAQENLMSFGNIQTDPKVKISLFKAALRMFIPIGGGTAYKIDPMALIARAYLELGARDSALYYAKQAYKAAGSMYLSERVGPAYILAAAYKGRNADSALKYTDIFYRWRDSLVNIDKAQRVQAMGFAEQQRQQEAAAQRQAYKNSLRTYLLTAIITFFLVLAVVFWRNNRRQKQTNLLLNEQKEEIETQRDNLEETLQDLKNTQSQLVQREKMASLGELTAGIAHEIQNPLNFVNNFSDVNDEMIDELKDELKSGNVDEALSLAVEIQENERKIRHHGKRADSIVKGMLEHSRTGTGEKQPTDLNTLADEYLRLSYHGLRAKDKDFNAVLATNFDAGLPKANVVQQDISRVLLNLFNNAFYAVNQKMKTAGAGYKPEVSVTTSSENGSVVIKVKDNGNGIPEAIKDKIMQPFFTTKPTGEGTGLGLSLSYDIVVKGHGGSIHVDTKEGEFTEFMVTLPL
ncbi:MAG TPA: ATP-binding protein [Mucilaginibacter sp.]|jgi:signal transduction histidine kinase|nr:ATP-binding protein [Mucilaginibacter sp.]